MNSVSIYLCIIALCSGILTIVHAKCEGEIDGVRKAVSLIIIIVNTFLPPGFLARSTSPQSIYTLPERQRDSGNL